MGTTRPRTAPAHRPLRAGDVVVAVAALVALVAVAVAAGVTQTNEARTSASSDGLRASVGRTLWSDIMVLSAGVGEPGTVLGAVANHGESPATVTVGTAGRGPAAVIELAEGETALLGPREHRVHLEGVPEPPGGLVELRVASDGGDARVWKVPVLDGTVEHYAGLVPTG